MTDVNPAICRGCARLDRTTVPPGTVTAVPRVCTAFPNGIPDAILRGADHRQPVGGEVDGRTFLADPLHSFEFDAWQRFAHLREAAPAL